MIVEKQAVVGEDPTLISATIPVRQDETLEGRFGPPVPQWTPEEPLIN